MTKKGKAKPRFKPCVEAALKEKCAQCGVKVHYLAKVKEGLICSRCWQSLYGIAHEMTPAELKEERGG